jgi:flagellar hook-associated protein 3 FlgL
MRVDPLYTSNLSAAVDQTALVEQNLTQQLASGMNVQTLSDNPTAVAQSALFSSQLSGLDTFVKTSTAEQSLLQVTGSALGETVTQLTSAISVATGVSSGTQNSSDLAAAAANVAGIRNQVLSLANTSFLGQYLFSGSQGSKVAFTLDSTTDPATATYNGDANTQSVATPYGQSVPVSIAGSAIFTTALAGLNQLVSDLAAGNSAGVAADSSAISAALATVSQSQSVLNGSLSQLTSTSTYAQTQSTNITAAQSNLISADPAAVATELSTSEVQHQALLSVIASLSKTDLFDDL